MLETLAMPSGLNESERALRLWFGFGVAPLVVALSLFAGIRMGAGRRVAWWSAIVLHVVLLLVYGAIIYAVIASTAEEFPFAMLGLIFYSPILAMSIVGLVLLLRPRTIAYSRGVA